MRPSKRRKYIQTLKKRMTHLKERVEAADRDGKNLSFDRLEAVALGWAIQTLEEMEIPRGEA